MRTLRALSIMLGVVALIAACTAAKPGWTYAPAPSPTPLPSVSPSGSVEPSAPASASPSAPASPSVSAGTGTVVDISASSSTAFDQASVTAPADQAFVIHFANTESGIPHNVEIKDSGGASLMRGEPIITGPAEADYPVNPLAAGEYQFVCSVHPNMTGTLTAE